MNYTGQQSAHIKQHAVAKRCHYSKYVHCIYNNKQSTAIKLKRVVEEYLTEERTITNISNGRDTTSRYQTMPNAVSSCYPSTLSLSNLLDIVSCHLQ